MTSACTKRHNAQVSAACGTLISLVHSQLGKKII